MEINKDLISILKSKGIHVDNAVCCLIALYHGYQPTYLPHSLIKEIKAAGIIVIITKTVVEKNIKKTTMAGVDWKIPLYEKGQAAFDWVKDEYVPLFKEANPKKGGYVPQANTRMKKLFANNPDIRKDEVIGATKLYLRQTDSNFIRFPHYFIAKGTGTDKTEDILDWVQRYREALAPMDRGTDNVTTMMQ